MSTREAPPTASGTATTGGPGPQRSSGQNPRAGHSSSRAPGLSRNGQGAGRRVSGGRRAGRRSASAVDVRTVRRVVRRVDLWSVLRFSALLYTSFLLVFVVAGVGLWLAASATGARHSVEHFIASTLLFKNFQFDSLQILGSCLLIGLVMVVLATMISVVVATFYNLISDVVGGVEFTLIEDQPIDDVV